MNNEVKPGGAETDDYAYYLLELEMKREHKVETTAPYTHKKDDDANTSPSPGIQSHRGKERVNGKPKSSHRSRSRSKVARSSERDLGDTGRSGAKNGHGRERHQETEREKLRSRDKDRDKKQRTRDLDKKQDRKRSRSKEKKRSRSRDKKVGGSKDKRQRSKSKEKRKGSSKERRRSRSKDKSRNVPEDKIRSKSRERRYNTMKENRANILPQKSIPRRRTPSPRPFRRGRTPPNGLGNHSPIEDLTPEERDARTVFCMQLSQRIRARDLEEFFSSVGKVRDVRLITCNKTKRFKGIAYIEFKDPESVPLALGLSGQRLLGVPICVQHTQAEKNRMANSMPNLVPKNQTGPMRLYVGSLHFNITEDMLRGIFEPFGKIDSIQLIMDPETGRSKGYGFITFHNAEDAKKALEQLNGFELAGRPMKVGNVTERLDMNTNASLDTDEMDRSGIDLGATGRLQLMFKLAEGAGLAVPQAAANALLATAPQPPPIPQSVAPPIATQCFMLSNMFDPISETNSAWEIEIQDDVISECNKHGGVLHVYVDKASPQGNVYVKCPSIATAVLSVNSLHGRWFAGRMITAAYVPLVNYHSLFPDALTAANLLLQTKKT